MIPLIGGRSKSRLALSESDRIKVMLAKAKQTEHLALIKPDRTMGAPWMDEYVHTRMSVYLCDGCSKRYDRWYEKYNYVFIARAPQKLADCDGCGKRFAWCNGFHPHEKPAQYAIGSLAGYNDKLTIGEFL